jgi:hypothetical protein
MKATAYEALLAEPKTKAMKHLTREEAAGIATRPDGKTSWFRGVLFGMSVGDIILIEPHDWKQQRAPMTVIKWMPGTNGRAWKCKRVMGQRSWVIERVK